MIDSQHTTTTTMAERTHTMNTTPLQITVTAPRGCTAPELHKTIWDCECAWCTRAQLRLISTMDD